MYVSYQSCSLVHTRRSSCVDQIVEVRHHRCHLSYTVYALNLRTDKCKKCPKSRRTLKVGYYFTILMVGYYFTRLNLFLSFPFLYSQIYYERYQIRNTNVKVYVKKGTLLGFFSIITHAPMDVYSVCSVE